MPEYVALIDMDGTLCDYTGAVRAGLEGHAESWGAADPGGPS